MRVVALLVTVAGAVILLLLYRLLQLRHRLMFCILDANMRLCVVSAEDFLLVN